MVLILRQLHIKMPIYRQQFSFHSFTQTLERLHLTSLESKNKSTGFTSHADSQSNLTFLIFLEK